MPVPLTADVFGPVRPSYGSVAAIRERTAKHGDELIDVREAGLPTARSPRR